MGAEALHVWICAVGGLEMGEQGLGVDSPYGSTPKTERPMRCYYCTIESLPYLWTSCNPASHPQVPVVQGGAQRKSPHPHAVPSLRPRLQSTTTGFGDYLPTSIPEMVSGVRLGDNK